MHTYTNRLADEKSPYLLQHAHNPVDWHPWSEEAFAVAEREDKPIFLSIGYATCHWCHVMERESFENEEIARLLNEAFVCIKVDREERPDIDSVYMTVCQMMTGQGGWPLTLLMTPDKKPFHAATYIPPEARFGRTGMKQLIPRVSEAWKTRRDDILKTSGKITEALSSAQGQDASGARFSVKVLDEGCRDLMQQYDARRGGFGEPPKFPSPHRLIFLLRHGEPEGINAVEHTLKEMRKGGLFDQVGFGFHRYSTDADWLLPHFEKMLYDQAMLALAYTEAYERTGQPLYQQVTEEILTYVLRDMTAPEGGFYSAEDADSEGEEGLFYVWSAQEMEMILGEDYAFAAESWNISPAGNFRDEATGQVTGKNIAHLSELPVREDADRLESIRQKLFEVRERRIHPLKDTKVLADWNGLMIAAFARAGRIFGRPEYVQVATKAGAFVAAEMQCENGELWHRWRDGHTAVPGQLDDYAFMIQGRLELYDATLEVRHLEAALAYNEVLTASFADRDGGGYFMTAGTAEKLIVRPKDIFDGALPSGNAVQMNNLLRMARLTSRFELEEQPADAGRVFGFALQRSPSSFAQALTAFQFGAGKSVEIVVVGRREDPGVIQMLEAINRVYEPCKTVLFKDVSDSARLENVAPFTRDMLMVDGGPTAYICRNFTCEQPVLSADDLKERLRQMVHDPVRGEG